MNAKYEIAYFEATDFEPTDGYEIIINGSIKIPFNTMHFTGASVILESQDGSIQAFILMDSDEYDTLVNRCKEAKRKSNG
jgi:hypothetical protein